MPGPYHINEITSWPTTFPSGPLYYHSDAYGGSWRSYPIQTPEIPSFAQEAAVHHALALENKPVNYFGISRRVSRLRSSSREQLALNYDPESLPQPQLPKTNALTSVAEKSKNKSRTRLSRPEIVKASQSSQEHAPMIGVSETLHLQKERSYSSTNISTVESEGERSFIGSLADAQSTKADDPERFEHLSSQLTLKVLKGYLTITQRGVSQSSSGSSGSQERATAPKAIVESSQTYNTAGKRSAGIRDAWEEADDPDDRENSKRQRGTGAHSKAANSLLACPYFKMDPTRYSERNIEEQCYRGCSSSLLRSIPRLKQHLYRVHRRPEYYCSRCYIVFETQAQLESHNRQTLICEILEPRFQEKMTNDQMNAIKRRNRRARVTVEWCSIFLILFPNQDLPISPFADQGSSQAVQSFVAFFNNEAPSILSDLIREELDGRLFLEEDTRALLHEAFETAVSRLLLRARTRLNQLSSSAPAEALESIPAAPLNLLEPADEGRSAIQNIQEFINTTGPNDLLFDLSSESWVDPHFFDGIFFDGNQRGA